MKAGMWLLNDGSFAGRTADRAPIADRATASEPRPTSPYQLPDGRIVPIFDDLARGAQTITYTLRGGPVVHARKVR